MRILIKNGYIIGQGKKDILIENNIISKIQNSIEHEHDEFIDANGMHIFPGFVDVHCHLRDPGFEYKEDIESGTRSAAAGGFTSVACMPNTNPVIDNEAVVKYIKEKSEKSGHVKVYPIGSVTKNQEGKILSEMGSMKDAGIKAVSDDGKPIESSSLMLKAMLYASSFNLKVISHCEDMSLSKDGAMNEGYVSTVLGLKGIPSVAEDIMVARDLLLAEYTKTPIHIAHISTKNSVNLIRQAKKRGVIVTCETCPHYFSLTESMCKDYNTYAKVNPPLKTNEDVEEIIRGLKDGTIDIIATDHAPHHQDEKNVEFDYALNGMIGFETAFSVAYTYLVEKNHLTLEELAVKMSYNPAKFLGIEGGRIIEGAVCDMTIADIGQSYTLSKNELKSKSKNTPYEGFELKGKIKYTLVEGKIVYKGE